MKRAAGYVFFGLALLAGLSLARLHGYLLFHSVAEGFSIVIACTVFVIAWNARRVLDNHYFLLVGISFLSVAALDFVHTLAYRGMGVFPEHGADLPTQLWIAARFVESLSFLAAPLFIRRRLPAWPTLLLYILATAALLCAVFTPGGFPECYREGSGLTPFKVASEYVISGILLGAAILLTRARDAFEPGIYYLVTGSILMRIAQEMSFTLYGDVYGFFNALGHFLKVLSFWLLYLALIHAGLRRPYEVLFRSVRESERALRSSEEQFRNLAEESFVGVLVIQDNRIRYVNRRLVEMFGYPLDEVVNRMSPADIIVPEDLPLLEENLRRRMAGDRSVTHTPYRAVRKDGAVLNVEVHSAMIPYQGRPAIMGTVIDVTNHVQVQEAVRHLAYHDSLTGLPNRLLLQDRVETALVAAHRGKRRAALLMLDLDGFKEVNDTFGHAVGDLLLKEVAGRLRNAVRESDTVARLGGDEFVVFLPEIDKEKAAFMVAEKILASFGSEFLVEDRVIRSSTSIGIAIFPEDGRDGRSLLRNADEAMYRAKEGGRNRVEVARGARCVEGDPGQGSGPDRRADSL